ncbi:MAG: Coenzyme F420 hydrogenase/dehydrogenase, beta subunit C-terminal domain [Alphaproteobacteria bacterium]|nr:Coenzyme F420 hydrogenase/dehydrogenase, beta subunit C-terminal domain [Alphaproteobacteria bacterium]
MTPAERLNAISEQGLCIGCGLCRDLGATGEIEIARTPEGSLRPIPGPALTDATVDKVYALCPGTRMEGLPEELTAADTPVDLVWGPVRAVPKVHASDREVRFKGATGGALTALAIHLLESGRVDMVLHATADPENPSFGKRQVSRSRDDVLAGAGSRYGPTATLIDITDLLDRGERFAFIGTPCDVTALRNLATADDRVDTLCPIMLAPICGGFMETPAFARAVAENGLAFDRLTHVRYRGHGCPGPTRLEQDNGKVAEPTYLDFWGEDDSAWSLPWRCKICPDGIGEAADIVATDTWPGGAPTPKQASDHSLDPGSNGLIVRSERGAELVASAVAAGALTIESEEDVDALSLWQPHQVRRKQAAHARLQAIADSGRIAPVTRRLRLEEIAAVNPPEINARQRSGTAERIVVGKATEPTPRRG